MQGSTLKQTLKLVCVGLLTVAPMHAQEAAPDTLTGRVLNLETAVPLADVEVFIPGTMAHDRTDETGFFQLNDVPPGSEALVFSRPGYQMRSYPMPAPSRDRATTLDYVLRPTPVDAVTMPIGPSSRGWDRALNAFRPLFLGETPNAEACTLLNPDVLRFTRKRRYLAAEAEAPLLIENRALGYLVTYRLLAFERDRRDLSVQGLAFFDFLPPSAGDPEVWERNRLAAYRGSLRHFLAALAAGRIEEAGFTVNTYAYLKTLRPETILGNVAWDEVLMLGKPPFKTTLFFDEEWQVQYQGPGAEEPSVSWISLTGPVQIDPYGNVDQGARLTTRGEWANARIADWLPREYRPEPEQ